MNTLLRSLVLIALLAGCSFSGSYKKSPQNLDNACSILDQRRSFLPAFRAAKRKYGVPISTQMAVIWQESKFKADAKPP
ncbi:lytic transglycosylase, partial [Sulfitobacter sp.]|nr:lytic transglycosylase [Sulfitobacter sp.]